MLVNKVQVKLVNKIEFPFIRLKVRDPLGKVIYHKDYGNLSKVIKNSEIREVSKSQKKGTVLLYFNGKVYWSPLIQELAEEAKYKNTVTKLELSLDFIKVQGELEIQFTSNRRFYKTREIVELIIVKNE